MGFVIEPGIRINGTAFEKYALHGIDGRIARFFSDIVKESDYGTVEIAAEKIIAIGWDLPIGMSRNIQKFVVGQPNVLKSRRRRQFETQT